MRNYGGNVKWPSNKVAFKGKSIKWGKGYSDNQPRFHNTPL